MLLVYITNLNLLTRVRFKYNTFYQMKCLNIEHMTRLKLFMYNVSSNFYLCQFQFESKLRQCPVRKPGYFTDIEFVEALDSFVPLAPERLLQRLFSQSVKHFSETGDAVNINRISRIFFVSKTDLPFLLRSI